MAGESSDIRVSHSAAGVWHGVLRFVSGAWFLYAAILLSPAWLQLHTFPEALAHSRTNPTPQPRLSSANSGRTSSHGDNAQAAAPSSHAPSEARSLAKEGERAQRSVAERARGGGTSNFGRRTTKTYDDKITEYIWDGDDLIHERTTDNKSGQSLPLTTWIQEPGTFTPLAKIQGRKRYGIVSDHLGSPTLVTTEAGRIAWQAQLDVYGVPREEGAAVRPEDKTDNPWRFPGQYEDAETGLYYNRFRYYDPELGRYLSEDPIGLLGGEALFGYVHEPLGWWDPLGLACKKKKRRDPTGSYTLLFGSGKRYHGKGPRKRSEASGKRVARENKDTHVATDWTVAKDRRDAYKQESRRLDADGGPGDPNNYNRIEQPGKKYRREDGEIP